MAKRFLVSLDLGTNELQNAVIQNLPAASEPSGVKGRVYFDSTNNKLKVYDGTAWQPLAIGANAASTVTLEGDVTGTANVSNGTITISTTIASNSVALGTDTTGNYVNDITAGTGVTVTHTPAEGSSPTVAIGQAVGTTDSVSFAGLTLSSDAAVNGGDVTTTATTASLFNANATTLNIGGAATTISIGANSGTTTVNNSLTVTGDLTVEGTTTTLNTATLEVEDNLVLLNKGVTGSPSLDAGLEIERGTSANVSILWNETSDLWTLTNDGTNYHSVARKHVADIAGDTATTAFAITHNLGTREVQVQVYDAASPYDTVEVDVERTSTSVVTIRFATAPSGTTNYKVVTVG
jgi:hypothetical protein